MNQVSIIMPHVYSFQVARFIPILTFQLGKYLVLFSIHDVIAHPLFTHGQLECFGNVLHGNAHTGSLVPVDINSQLRFREFQVQIRRREHGTFVYLIHENR